MLNTDYGFIVFKRYILIISINCQIFKENTNFFFTTSFNKLSFSYGIL